MPVELSVAAIDEKLFEQIIRRDEVWRSPEVDKTGEATTLAPRDRKMLLGMVQGLLTEQLRLATENMALRTKLIQKLSRMTALGTERKDALLQRDVARKLVQEIVDKASFAGWPVHLVVHVKGLLEVWERQAQAEGVVHGHSHHGGEGGGQVDPGE